MTATERACGKVILLGEHVVVYGAPALVAGIDRGATATASAAEGSSASLTLSGRQVGANPDGDDLARAFHALLEVAPASAPVSVVAETDLPAGAGLGCSAALGVAIARAVESHAGRGASPIGVAARASAWEGVFHGSPSGVDTAAASLGGCLRFDKVAGPRPLRLRSELSLCIGHTGVSSSTRTMVEAVAQLRERRPERVDDVVRSVAALVENACLAVEAGDLEGLGRLMDLNQMLLASLMVSTEAIESLCATARSAGALGAKLTGAGGGGCVVALLPRQHRGEADAFEPDPDEVAHAVLAGWKADGFDGFRARVAVPSRHAHAHAEEAP